MGFLGHLFYPWGFVVQIAALVHFFWRRRASHVWLWVIFIGVIGGLLSIGFIGIFIGPLVMAAGYSIVMSWLSDDDGRRRVRTQK